MMTWIDQLQPANWNRASGIALASYILGCFTTGFYYVRLRTEQDILEEVRQHIEQVTGQKQDAIAAPF